MYVTHMQMTPSRSRGRSGVWEEQPMDASSTARADAISYSASPIRMRHASSRILSHRRYRVGKSS